MAWIHKEENWRSAYVDNWDDGNTWHGWIIVDGIPEFKNNMNHQEWVDSGQLSFPDWLDLHCSDGWEVLKISRAFKGHIRDQGTWVVFRKQA